MQSLKHQVFRRAFAAIFDNGFVVTWGLPDFGGDSSAVWQSLRNVLRIQAARAAFAAVLSNGTIVSWGQLNRTGGTMDAVHNQVTSVSQLQGAAAAFAAVLADGSLVSWGHSCYGGNSCHVNDQLRLQANFAHVRAASNSAAMKFCPPTPKTSKSMQPPPKQPPLKTLIVSKASRKPIEGPAAAPKKVTQPTAEKTRPATPPPSKATPGAAPALALQRQGQR